MTRLDLNDIQGNVLEGYSMPSARYTFLQFHDGVLGRRFIQDLLDHITTSQPWPKGPGGRPVKPTSTLNVAFTHTGLRLLDVPIRTLDGFSVAYKQGMRARAHLLGDIGKSSPEHWDWDRSWRDGKQVHMLILLNAGDPDRNVPSGDQAKQRLFLMPKFDWLQEMVEKNGGLEIIGYQDAGALGGRKEHFGYTDGISNPDLTGDPGRRGTRIGRLTPDNRWEPLAAGEVLLGHPDEAMELPEAPLPNLFARNGTYLVYRKLHQNVATFRQFLEDEGARYPGGKALLAAKLVGRWQDGTPLELSPTQPDASKITNNDFRYGQDMDGLKCPLGAHIRRANPRDHLGFEGKLTNRHRILRRGLPYGQALRDGDAVRDEDERGVIFIALNASIERQFEFVQREWMNYGNDFFQGNDKDPIAGAHEGSGKMVIPGDPEDFTRRPTWICASLKSFVETRGGEYFFMPSLTALRHIAARTVETI